MARKVTPEMIEGFDKAYQRILNGERFLFYDLETTGLKTKEDKIISCSAIKGSFINGSFIEESRLNEFIKPLFPVSELIENLTGITNEFLADKKSESEVIPIIKDFFDDVDIICGFNNLGFDDIFMQTLYSRYCFTPFEKSSLDLYSYFVRNIPDGIMENKKQATVVKYLHFDNGLTFHQSLDDVIALSRLFIWYATTDYDSFFAEKLAEKRLEDDKKEKVILIAMAPWSKNQIKRIYVDFKTSIGEGHVYYDTIHKTFGEKDTNILPEINSSALLDDMNSLAASYGFNNCADIDKRYYAPAI